jgi:hypothetical protein
MVSTNTQKTPIGLSLNRHARTKALDQIWKRGLSLPCQVVAVRGPIVQVSFQVQQPAGTTQATIPNVTIPIIGAEYVRMPIQAGCKGVALAMDAYLGGMSGIGGGVATLTQQGNLTALMFAPIGNAGWFTVNGNILTAYGPGGVTLMDQGQTTFINLTPGEIQLTAGGKTLTINAAGIVIDGIVWEIHTHGGVQTGSGDTGPPI